MTRSRRSPAAINKAAYSASVRSTPPGDDKHGSVDQLNRVWFVPGGNDGLRDKPSSVRLHRVPAIAQDAHRLFVIPVVNDLLQNISVRARRNRIEEAPGRELGMRRKIPHTSPRHLNA